MTKEELIALIAKTRRVMPRNPDIMALCDYAENPNLERKPFDKVAYQREYMRQRRHKTKRTEEKTGAP